MKESEARQHRRHEDGYPVQQIASDTFQIRRAIAQDADIISWHRARMFQDMGDVSGDAFEILRAKARTRLEQWIDNGNYIGWLATPADEPEMTWLALASSCNRSCRAHSIYRRSAKADRERL